MPVIRTKSQTPTSVIEDTLRRELTNELRTSDAVDPSTNFRQPRILENFIDQANALNVTVIWDRWKLIPSSKRILIIHDAYSQVKRQDYERLAVVNGVTGVEAQSLGLLPYEVELDGYADPQLLLQEGAFEGPAGPLLLFTDRPTAENALAKLSAITKQSGVIIEHPPT